RGRTRLHFDTRTAKIAAQVDIALGRLRHLANHGQLAHTGILRIQIFELLESFAQLRALHLRPATERPRALQKDARQAVRLLPRSLSGRDHEDIRAVVEVDAQV